MAKKIWAFIAFNAYSACFLGAFQVNTAHLFDTELLEKGIDLREWGWGDHYIWLLFSSVVASALAGLLCGAIAKSKGNRTAAISNVPLVLLWLLGIIGLAMGNTETVGKIGFIIVYVIAIPLTTFVAYRYGAIGEECQKKGVSENTVFGIRSFHWVWAIFPIYFYALGAIYVGTRYLHEQFAFTTTSLLGIIVSLLMLLTVIAWLYPLRLAHRVLTGELLSAKSAGVRALANFGILTVGLFAATGIQFGVSRVLGKILK